MRTFSESIAGPVALGKKLGGAGHTLFALQYASLAALCGLLPLTLVTAAPLLAWIDARRLGLDSTGFLGAAVSLVLGSVVCSTLVAIVVAALAGCVWLSARLLRVSVRYDVLLRALAYGTSPLAVPLLGPLLLPLAASWSCLSAYGVLCLRSAPWRAVLALLMPASALAAGALWMWF
jgi:hypothetical protein